MLLGSFWQDARFAARVMVRSPGHTALCVLTLALGIGATTAVFTVVDRSLLRRLPFPDPERLVTVWTTYPSWQGHHILDDYWDEIALSYPEYRAWSEGQTFFSSTAAYGATQMALTGRGDPVGLAVGRASSTLLQTLGAEPLHGRWFAASEEGRGAPPVAVVGYGLWNDRLGADPDVIGQSVLLDARPFTVIGVLPRGLRFAPVSRFSNAGELDLWIPIGADGASLDRGDHQYEGIARLHRAGLTPAVVDEAARLIRGDNPPERQGARLVPRLDAEVRSVRGPLLLLLGAVGLLMLITCVNLATLFLGRIAARRTELATRVAIGAAGGRVLRQFGAEALSYGAAGIAGGVALGAWGVAILVRLAPASMSLPPGIAIDGRALLFASGLGLVTCLIFGLLPIAVLQRLDPGEELSRGSARLGSRGSLAQRVLVGAQFCLSLVLLVGTGLLGRSLAAELAIDPGFERSRLLAADLALPSERYPGPTERSTMLERLVERLEAIPGVVRASGSSALPFSGRGGSSSFQIVGREVRDDEKSPEAMRRTVLPEFHSTLGIPLIRGRSITAADRDGAPEVVVVSEAMAQRFWPEGDALGARIVRDRREWEVVGIVGDVLADTLTGEIEATYYIPFHQDEAEQRSFVSLIAKTEVDAAALVPQIRAAIWDLDPALPIDRVEEVAQMVARSSSEQRYRTLLVSLFAWTASFLAAVGLFGVTARSLVQRRGDLGIRLALGARHLGLAVGETARESRALAVGVIAGVLVALAASRVLERFVFGVALYDPLTYVAATAMLGLIGLAACYLAAHRIVRLDPSTVLRAQ